MVEPSGKERAKQLAAELQKILKENLLKDPSLTNVAMARARAIREEIQQMGIMVTWKASLDSRDPKKIEVIVTLWGPKENMTEEERKIYDEWFLRVNEIKPPE